MQEHEILQAITLPSTELTDLPKTVFFHGTTPKDLDAVLTGPKNNGNGFGGRGLYLSPANQGTLANELTKIRNQFKDTKPLVLCGTLNPAKEFNVASINLVRNPRLVDLTKGFFPTDWAKNTDLQKLIHKNFDLIMVNGPAKAGLALSNRYFVMTDRAGPLAVCWQNMLEVKSGQIKSLPATAFPLATLPKSMPEVRFDGRFSFTTKINDTQWGEVSGKCGVIRNNNNLVPTIITEQNVRPFSSAISKAKPILNKIAPMAQWGLKAYKTFSFAMESHAAHPELYANHPKTAVLVHLSVGVGTAISTSAVWATLSVVAGVPTFIPLVCSLLDKSDISTDETFKSIFNNLHPELCLIGPNTDVQAAYSEALQIQNIDNYNNPWGEQWSAKDFQADELTDLQMYAIEPDLYEAHLQLKVFGFFGKIVNAVTDRMAADIRSVPFGILGSFLDLKKDSATVPSAPLFTSNTNLNKSPSPLTHQTQVLPPSNIIPPISSRNTNGISAINSSIKNLGSTSRKNAGDILNQTCNANHFTPATTAKKINPISMVKTVNEILGAKSHSQQIPSSPTPEPKEKSNWEPNYTFRPYTNNFLEQAKADIRHMAKTARIPSHIMTPTVDKPHVSYHVNFWANGGEAGVVFSVNVTEKSLEFMGFGAFGIILGLAYNYFSYQHQKDKFEYEMEVIKSQVGHADKEFGKFFKTYNKYIEAAKSYNEEQDETLKGAAFEKLSTLLIKVCKLCNELKRNFQGIADGDKKIMTIVGKKPWSRYYLHLLSTSLSPEMNDPHLPKSVNRILSDSLKRRMHDKHEKLLKRPIHLVDKHRVREPSKDHIAKLMKKAKEGYAELGIDAENFSKDMAAYYGHLMFESNVKYQSKMAAFELGTISEDDFDQAFKEHEQEIQGYDKIISESRQVLTEGYSDEATKDIRSLNDLSRELVVQLPSSHVEFKFKLELAKQCSELEKQYLEGKLNKNDFEFRVNELAQVNDLDQADRIIWDAHIKRTILIKEHSQNMQAQNELLQKLAESLITAKQFEQSSDELIHLSKSTIETLKNLNDSKYKEDIENITHDIDNVTKNALTAVTQRNLIDTYNDLGLIQNKNSQDLDSLSKQFSNGEVDESSYNAKMQEFTGVVTQRLTILEQMASESLQFPDGQTKESITNSLNLQIVHYSNKSQNAKFNKQALGFAKDYKSGTITQEEFKSKVFESAKQFGQETDNSTAFDEYFQQVFREKLISDLDSNKQRAKDLCNDFLDDKVNQADFDKTIPTWIQDVEELLKKPEQHTLPEGVTVDEYKAFLNESHSYLHNLMKITYIQKRMNTLESTTSATQDKLNIKNSLEQIKNDITQLDHTVDSVLLHLSFAKICRTHDELTGELAALDAAFTAASNLKNSLNKADMLTMSLQAKEEVNRTAIEIGTRIANPAVIERLEIDKWMQALKARIQSTDFLMTQANTPPELHTENDARLNQLVGTLLTKVHLQLTIQQRQNANQAAYVHVGIDAATKIIIDMLRQENNLDEQKVAYMKRIMQDGFSLLKGKIVSSIENTAFSLDSLAKQANLTTEEATLLAQRCSGGSSGIVPSVDDIFKKTGNYILGFKLGSAAIDLYLYTKYQAQRQTNCPIPFEHWLEQQTKVSKLHKGYKKCKQILTTISIAQIFHQIFHIIKDSKNPFTLVRRAVNAFLSLPYFLDYANAIAYAANDNHAPTDALTVYTLCFLENLSSGDGWLQIAARHDETILTGILSILDRNPYFASAAAFITEKSEIILNIFHYSLSLFTLYQVLQFDGPQRVVDNRVKNLFQEIHKINQELDSVTTDSERTQVEAKAAMVFKNIKYASLYLGAEHHLRMHLYIESLFKQHEVAQSLQFMPYSNDGNGMYIATALYTEYDHLELRHLAADYIQNHKAFFEPFINTSEYSFDDYLIQIKQAGTFGDELTLRALCQVLKRQIVIVYSGFDLDLLKQGLSDQNSIIACENPIYISYDQQQMQYDGLRLRGELYFEESFNKELTREKPSITKAAHTRPKPEMRVTHAQEATLSIREQITTKEQTVRKYNPRLFARLGISACHAVNADNSATGLPADPPTAEL